MLRLAADAAPLSAVGARPSGMSATVYAALSGAALKRVRIGGLEAVYHVPSGITHLLAEPVPDLLDALEALGPDHAVSPEQLLRLIADRFDIEGDDPAENPEAVLAERLSELAVLGIVQAGQIDVARDA